MLLSGLYIIVWDGGIEGDREGEIEKEEYSLLSSYYTYKNNYLSDDYYY